MEIDLKSKKVQPPPKIKDLIMRTYFYMNKTYGVNNTLMIGRNSEHQK